jgi:hypothetical protein
MSQWSDMSIRGLLFQCASTIKIQLSVKQQSLTRYNYKLHEYITINKHIYASLSAKVQSPIYLSTSMTT